MYQHKPRIATNNN